MSGNVIVDQIRSAPGAHTELRGKNVLVVGLARQGTALARFLVAEGALVTVTDLQGADALVEHLASLKGLPVRYVLGAHPVSLLEDVDLVCLSGGVPPSLPLVVEARDRGIEISNDAKLTLERSRARVVGITGSAGKTTTTTLTGLMLREAGVPVHIGGNIGSPLIDHLDAMDADHWAIMELSSFQLDLFDSSPPLAAVTNVTPNHLDRHGSMAEYTTAKANILRWQSRDNSCVLGADDPVTGQWLREGAVEITHEESREITRFPILSRRLGFSVQWPLSGGAYLEDGQLRLCLPNRPAEVICARENLRVRGLHNVANVLAACVLAGAVGAPTEAMAEVARTFLGVEHRLEVVRTLRDTLWVNDSIATTPERSAAAVSSFNDPIILLAGGRDKKLPWGDWARLVRTRVHHLVLFGEAAELAEAAVRSEAQEHAAQEMPSTSLLTVTRCGDLEEAVKVACRLARPGNVVLLAPGATSFDAYKDFAARGEHFRSLVWELQE
jgi:UDP-N-acetylmuramoylalanine--D-glutamate ligase